MKGMKYGNPHGGKSSSGVSSISHAQNKPLKDAGNPPKPQQTAAVPNVHKKK